jgi:single-stranded DNA-binding protein
MISALAQGELIADPKQRLTASGKAFATGTVRVGAGPESVLIGIAAFSETAAASLGRLKSGDTLAASGVLELNIWQDREGKERRDWRVTATQIMTLYEATKRRKAAAEVSE